MDTDVANTEQDLGQVDQQQDQDDNVDYKALYFDEVTNSKKQRKAKQDAQAEVAEFTKTQEEQKVSQMKEQEKFQELSEELQKQLDTATPYKERWETHENNNREKLIAQLPEEDRERMSKKDTDTLEYIVSKLNTEEPQKPSAPQHNPGKSRNINVSDITKEWTKFDKGEQRDKWDDIVKGYQKH